LNRLIRRLAVTLIFVIQCVSWRPTVPDVAANRRLSPRLSPVPQCNAYEPLANPACSAWHPCVWPSTCYAPRYDMSYEAFNLGDDLSGARLPISGAASALSQPPVQSGQSVNNSCGHNATSSPKFSTATSAAAQYRPLSSLSKYDFYPPVIELPYVSSLQPSGAFDVTFSAATQVCLIYQIILWHVPSPRILALDYRLCDGILDRIAVFLFPYL
jgi:hypothetical protein